MMSDEGSSVERSGFKEEYESLADHEVANINPFASSKHQQGISLETVSNSSSSSPSSSPVASLRSRSFSPSFDPLTQQAASSTGTTKRNATTSRNRPMNSLLDNSRSSSPEPLTDDNNAQAQVRMTQSAATSGMAGFLEMEEEPTRYTSTGRTEEREAELVLEQQDDLIDFTPADEPIQTTSGLLLTHRRTSAENRAKKVGAARSVFATRGAPASVYPPSYRPSSTTTRFEVESSSPWGTSDSSGFGRAPGAIMQARRLLSFAKLWVLFFCAVLVLGTGVIFHSTFHRSKKSSQKKTNQQNQNNNNQLQELPKHVLLLPLNNAAELARQQREAEEEEALQQQQHQNRRGARRLLSNLNDLRTEFEDWIVKHGKRYPSDHEKEHRFGIWKDNHFRTAQKNKKHGNCPMMKQPVFGSNHLQDLTTEEFQTQFLTGYNGPNADGHEVKTGRKRRLVQTSTVMHDGLDVTRHPTVHNRLLREWQMAGYGISTSSCKWYAVSCWMRVIFNEFLYVGTGTMEPKYDSDQFPNSIDWRDYGAVTDVRRQGDCGACWAITAVETVESAYFIGTGSLLDLSETEVISCTDSCNMCYGGWPQDAYDYVMDHKGIMLSNDWGYDGETLLSLSQEMQVDETELDSDLFASYISQNCPASEGSGSGDNNDGDGSSRYGSIKGYGFATDRCVCYSDGSGCDCDNQNEGVAVRNIASYGPATVCLDASVWQDYSGGIITSDSGCSAKFLAMNHCVQVVGYAYNTGNDGDGEDEEGGSGDSGSNSQDSGSGDGSDREGYWIVRNQWSSNWGMSGYAYVAMGENTCGILNDMTQAYM